MKLSTEQPVHSVFLDSKNPIQSDLTYLYAKVLGGAQNRYFFGNDFISNHKNAKPDPANS